MVTSDTSRAWVRPAVATLLSVWAASALASDPVSGFRWKSRVVLVFADNAQVSSVRGLQASLADASCQLTERDMIVGWVFADGSSHIGSESLSEADAEALRRRANIDAGTTTTILIGKDGGVKARYQPIPNLDEMFALIDGMPMRRSEMRTRPGSCAAESTQTST